MEDDPDTIRRRMALYRYYLAEGVSEALAAIYTRYIVIAEAELADLEGHKASGNGTQGTAERH
ncbi:MAG TPA: hypothetical protein VMU06_12965 [Stellaceae bacterium]|nr:hypothetical protein [Stellaceae bacterium]